MYPELQPKMFAEKAKRDKEEEEHRQYMLMVKEMGLGDENGSDNGHEDNTALEVVDVDALNPDKVKT